MSGNSSLQMHVFGIQLMFGLSIPVDKTSRYGLTFYMHSRKKGRWLSNFTLTNSNMDLLKKISYRGGSNDYPQSKF